MRTWRRVVVVLMVLATAFLFYRWWERAATRVKGSGERAQAVGAGTDESEPDLGVAAQRGSGQGAGRGGGAAPPDVDRAKADRMRAAIRALLAEAGPFVGSTPAVVASVAPATGGFPPMPVVPDGDAGGTKIDPDYLKVVVRNDFLPLAGACFKAAQAKNPALEGKAVIHFEILGDRKVGGVVSDAKLVEGTTIDDPEFGTCVTESMMSVTFDAPPEDGTLSISVPLRFSSTPSPASSR